VLRDTHDSSEQTTIDGDRASNAHEPFLTKRTQLVLVLSLTAVVAIAGGYLSVAREIQRTYDETCNGVTAIARDPQKMKYVQAWAASRTHDERFMAALRESSSFVRGDPRSRHYIDLDWSYLGFSRDLAWVEFNTNEVDQHDIDAAEIGSVSVTQGRSSIIIKLSAAGDLGLQWPPEAMKKLKPISDDVFVYCDSSG